MKKRSRKKTKPFLQTVIKIGFVLLGILFGMLIVACLNRTVREDAGIGEILIAIGIVLFELYIAFFLQILIHETGHLLFGLLTGYRFSSFRIGSFMWLFENGKIQLRKLSIAGTGGQCLMIPPEIKNDTFPYILYNLGGSLLNLVASLLFFLLYVFFMNIPYLSVFLLMAAAIGISSALTNGIPLHLEAVDNDGYNALSLGKNEEALHAFWIQMKINEHIARGVRLKDMPDAWFTPPSVQGMQNSMTAAIGVFACNRLMDSHRFKEADLLMERMIRTPSAMAGLHYRLLICDRIYCEIISTNHTEKIAAFLTDGQKKFMQSMKKFPTVLRTEYVIALHFDKNPEKAAKILSQFEKVARTYPYPADMESERELIRIAQTINKRRNI